MPERRPHPRRHRRRPAGPDDGRSPRSRSGSRCGCSPRPTGVSAAQVIPDHAGRRLHRPRRRCARSPTAAAVVTFDHEHVPTEHLHALEDAGVAVRPGPGGAGARPGQGRDAARGWPSSACRARATRWSTRSTTWRRSASRACSRPPAAATTARACGSSARPRTSPSRSGRRARPACDLLAEELVDFRRELSALVARSPSGQAAAYPVVASTQRDGICHEVVAPAPGPRPRAGRPGAGDRAADRRRARRHRHPRRRALRDQRRPGAGQRARDAPAQHRPLDPGRRGHLAVREPPARGAWTCRSARRSPRAPLDGDGQHPRRRPTPRSAACTTATRTRWPATRGCACTCTARTCARAARSATSTPTATTSRTAWSGRGTPPPGSAATSATRASER